MNFKRTLQALSLAAFITLLLLAAFPLRTWFPTDFFLRLDPLVFAGTVLGAREWEGALLPGLLIILATLFLGRFFCSCICPMGITLDISDRIFRPRDSGRHLSNQKVLTLRRIKYLVLFLILGTAIVGVSSVFIASPLSLITRFYGLVIYPFAVHLTDMGLDSLYPVYSSLGLQSLAYFEPQTYLFATQIFILAFFIMVFFLVVLAPRFWCRSLCPAGALLALFSRKPLISRKVSSACTECGLCQRRCPMQAIEEDPHRTSHQECIVCLECVRVCPEKAVSFQAGWDNEPAVSGFMPQRRKVMASVLGGVGGALLLQTGIREVRSDTVPGNVAPQFLIRPPGALEEEDFLGRCIRCGQCMKACPTNTLQPVWFESGVLGLFSPKVLPRRGPCDPTCNVCGRVCPTGAIRDLPINERVWARIGTARVVRGKCLAWAWDRKCLVCFEVCPYAALELRRVPGIDIPVPFVVLDKCAGCGACEYHCPVQAQSAIVVEPMNSLRMNKGSYIEEGRAQGMVLDPDPDREREPPEEIMPDTEEPDDLPPGFTD